jgi:hypothetical protein
MVDSVFGHYAFDNIALQDNKALSYFTYVNAYSPPVFRRLQTGRECPLLACAVQRRRFPVGENPTRQRLQPEATGAAMEETKWLKPSDTRAPPDERGGNRQTKPTATAPHLDSTGKRLSADGRFTTQCGHRVFLKADVQIQTE